MFFFLLVNVHLLIENLFLKLNFFKVIVAMETGFLPPNLHYKGPREGVPSLLEGRFEVVTEKTPWEGGLVGISALGFGGANCHILLKSHEKRKINQGIPQDDLPRLVVTSGRTEEAVKTLLDDVRLHVITHLFFNFNRVVITLNILHEYR